MIRKTVSLLLAVLLTVHGAGIGAYAQEVRAEVHEIRMEEAPGPDGLDGENPPEEDPVEKEGPGEDDPEEGEDEQIKEEPSSEEPGVVPEAALPAEPEPEPEGMARAMSVALEEAIPVSDHASLQAAIDDARDGDVIVLENDITLTGTIVINNNAAFSIHGNQYKLYSAGAYHFHVLSGTLTLWELQVDGKEDLGGICVGDDGVVILKSGGFENIIAKKVDKTEFAPVSIEGGGFFMDGGSIRNCQSIYDYTSVHVGIVNIQKGFFKLSDGQIIDNTAHQEINCGAIQTIGRDAEVQIVGGLIANNTFEGIYARSAGTISMSGGIISGNRRGVYLSGTASMLLSGGDICNHTSNGGRTGNGVDLRDSSSLTITGGRVYRNTADQNGGGIFHLSTVPLHIEGGEIFENTALADGGGIYAREVIMTGGTISKNVSSNAGGGLASNALTLEEGFISGNEAGSGGGVHLYDKGSLIMNGGSITHNIANNGAGIHTSVKFSPDTYQLLLQGGTISNNTTIGHGGGLFAQRYHNVVIDGVEIRDNQADRSGGGVYCDGETFEMKSGSVTGNQSGHSGGGIYLTTSHITITSGTVSTNQSGYDGGGIYVSNSNTKIQLEDCTVADNSAQRNGGGIYISTGKEPVLIDRCTISDNSAQQQGGGFYMDSSNGLVQLDECIISGNAAEHGAGIGYGSFGKLEQFQVGSQVTFNDNKSSEAFHILPKDRLIHDEYVEATCFSNGQDSACDMKIDLNASLKQFGLGISNLSDIIELSS